MHLGLDKKVVLLTGGTKGIGRTMVRSFLEEGATVHFCSRTKADVEATQSKLAKDFPNAKAFGTALDISNQTDLATWIENAAKESGDIDVLVPNVSALAIEDNAEAWQKAFQTDLLPLYTMIQTALPHLEKSKGNIVAIASVSGRDIDFTTPSPYGPCKAAMIHYIASLAHKLAPKGVRANTCSPGNIYIEDGVWGQVEKAMPELFKSQMAENVMGRMGKPEEVANAVLFLASNARAGFVSGANLTVDGSVCRGVQF